ncbi:MAG: hypothetical protein M3081_15165 [Gemmatimonadota bacterium]|nr:hypothetical protein [Gemmatimonadota bacterium]
MDPYIFSLVLGAVGLGAMALSGIGHQTHHGGGPGHAAHHGHGQAHHGALRGGGRHAGGAKGGAHSNVQSATRDAVFALMSPRVLFSVLLGLGATGVLLRGTLDGGWRLGAAIAGGILFERLLVTPVWNFSLRFASKPALTLESCIADEAKVVSGFDANGQGLVAIELDGQVVQLLGTLQSTDRAAGVRVRAGDRVRIEEVDSERNRCTVSAL